MATLTSFTFITLNGFYKDAGNGISWHDHGGSEEGQFSADNSQRDNILLFGRATYEMMASFWPTQMARESMPVVAKSINAAEKIVASRTLQAATWNNSRIIRTGLVDEVRKLKQGTKDITVLGSGSLLSQLTDAGLIDAYSIMLDPLALGTGTPIFHNIQQTLKLRLKDSRVFKSGTVLLNYMPA